MVSGVLAITLNKHRFQPNMQLNEDAVAYVSIVFIMVGSEGKNRASNVHCRLAASLHYLVLASFVV